MYFVRPRLVSVFRIHALAWKIAQAIFDPIELDAIRYILNL